MLKNLDPSLTPDILHALRAMGHGDTLVLVDTNFPAETVAQHTTLGMVLRMDNLPVAQAARAILSVLPLDFSFQPSAVWRMEVVGDPDAIHPVMREMQAEVDHAEGKPSPITALERFAFYERAKQAYCIVMTGETRFYGDFILAKGVIPPKE